MCFGGVKNILRFYDKNIRNGQVNINNRKNWKKVKICAIIKIGT